MARERVMVDEFKCERVEIRAMGGGGGWLNGRYYYLFRHDDVLMRALTKWLLQTYLLSAADFTESIH